MGVDKVHERPWEFERVRKIVKLGILSYLIREREGKITKLGTLLTTISISLFVCLSSVSVWQFLGLGNKEQKDPKTSQFHTYP